MVTPGLVHKNITNTTLVPAGAIYIYYTCSTSFTPICWCMVTPGAQKYHKHNPIVPAGATCIYTCSTSSTPIHIVSIAGWAKLQSLVVRDESTSICGNLFEGHVRVRNIYCHSQTTISLYTNYIIHILLKNTILGPGLLHAGTSSSIHGTLCLLNCTKKALIAPQQGR